MWIMFINILKITIGSIIYVANFESQTLLSLTTFKLSHKHWFIVIGNIIWVFPSIKCFGKNNKEESNENFISEWGHYLISWVQFQPHLGITTFITHIMSACNFFTQFSKEQETSVSFSLFIASNPTDRCFQNHVVCEHLKEYYICINSGNSKLRAFHTGVVFQINIFLFCTRHFVLLPIKQTLCAHIC